MCIYIYIMRRLAAPERRAPPLRPRDSNGNLIVVMMI